VFFRNIVDRFPFKRRWFMVRLALAGAFGACIGLMVSMAYGLSPLVSPLVGGTLSVCVYDPAAALHIIASIVLFRWVGPTVHALLAIAADIRRGWRPFMDDVVCTFSYLALAAALVISFGFILSTAILWLGWDISLEKDCFGCTVLTMMGVWFVALLWEAGRFFSKAGNHPYLPIMRRCPHFLSVLWWAGISQFEVGNQKEKKWSEMTPSFRLRFVFGCAFLLPFTSVPGAVIWLLDVVLSLLILGAQTKKFAAFTSGFLGAMTGEIVRGSGFAPGIEPALVLASGAIAGFCSGPLFYAAMRLAARPTPTIDCFLSDSA
jgi:hypothetical protein